MYELALLYFQAEYMEKAHIWFENSALKGHGGANYYLALFYDPPSGYGVGDHHSGQAAIYYAVAADAEVPEALCTLGKKWLYGDEFVPRDTKEGLKYLKKAAKFNNTEAIYELSKYNETK